jgi:hypothetical protein
MGKREKKQLGRMLQKFAKYDLSSDEKMQLANWVTTAELGELEQVNDLVNNCKNKFRFAKTHSVYLKNWEKTKAKMEKNLKKGKLPPQTSYNLHEAIIKETDEVMQKKLELVRTMFQSKFGESIYNYLGKDGKTKKFLGIF